MNKLFKFLNFNNSLLIKKILKFINNQFPFKIGLTFTALCIFLLLNHYRYPRNSIDIVGYIERVLYDMRFELRGQKPMSGVVGVLAADDKSIEAFGRWPFPRGIYEKAFDNLKKSGVKWIGFDVFFTEPSHRLLEESIYEIEHLFQNKQLNYLNFKAELQNMLTYTPGDISLANSIHKFGSIVQGFYYIENYKQIISSKYGWKSSYDRLKNSAIDFINFPTGMSINNYKYLFSPGVVTNTALIAGQSKSMGFVNNTPDADGLIRTSGLVKIINPIDSTQKTVGPAVVVPSLALALSANYLSSQIVVNFDHTGIDSIDLYPTNNQNPLINIPTYYEGHGKLLINHYGNFVNIPQISLKDAYDNNLPKKIPEILILGGTGTGTNDKRPSPFDENFDGVGHHAAIVENIISQNFMKRPISAPFLEITLLLFSGIILSYLFKKSSALKSSLIIISLIIIYYYIDNKYLFGNGNWYYSGMFYLQSLSLYFSISIFKYFIEEKEKKKVKVAFQHYLNPNVINQLIENPDKLKLGGEKKLLTVFFSDVRGFTTISETLSPEKLTALLNEYFTPMTKIILDSNGLLDKYIGDAIMAIWGAPIHLEDHADRAVHSSLKMIEELKILQIKWQEEQLPFLDIGIGLNTGEMVVGNMGSHKRFDYTVLGDSVNLGARLEGINKNYGTRIICSEFTKKSLIHPDKFLFRELDRIQVKGKSEPVRIYEVVDFNSVESSFKIKIIQLFEEGLALYREKKWDHAIQKFKDAILSNNGKDAPSEVFIKRCEYLKTNQIDNNWNGIWIFNSK